jgi:MerR family mercuric resistance operon transcriptional regulator
LLITAASNPTKARYLASGGIAPKSQRSAYVRASGTRIWVTLDEVRALLMLSSVDGQSACAEVREISATHLAGVRARIVGLSAIERVLAAAIRQCDAGEQPDAH